MKNLYQGESRSAADQPCLCSRCYRSACYASEKREEEVYHEAELKAMDELEEMMRRVRLCLLRMRRGVRGYFGISGRI